MINKGYLIFHLNLTFSSIEEESRIEVIKNCYQPLLDIVEEENLPFGIELTGWTLEQIKKLEPSWIDRLKKMLKQNQCELIGSGYCQVIGPLIPFSVNKWNQQIGLEVYKHLLDAKPTIALVNEMAFSDSLVDLYESFNYKGFVMDKDNIKLALIGSEADILPSHAIGTKGSELPILWGDSFLFQKLQQYAHGDISQNDYMEYLMSMIKDGKNLLPIYCNDAEVFDYRPGRFSTERSLHKDGEWNRVVSMLRSIQKEKISIISPSKALEKNIKEKSYLSQKLTSCAYPVPVKKQAKYNIGRWALSGRNDLKLNSYCYSYEEKLSSSESQDKESWKTLCELWSSDYRTHITESRWNNLIERFPDILDSKREMGFISKNKKSLLSFKEIIETDSCFTISKDQEDILLEISNDKICLILNMRRGLAIRQLNFKSHLKEPCIGTLSHGHFSDILHGADYYSANTIIEFPALRKRLTDLEYVEPMFRLNGDSLEVAINISSDLGNIEKVYKISKDHEEINILYNITDLVNSSASIRLGLVTLMESFNSKSVNVLCANGGDLLEEFTLEGNFNHASPVSSLVSSSRGFGATTGDFYLINGQKKLKLSWDPSKAAVIPMLQNNKIGEDALSVLNAKTF